MFEVRPDRLGATLEVIPNDPLSLSMAKVEKNLIAIGYQSIVSSPFLLIVKREAEFTIFPSGKLIARALQDKAKIRELATEIYAAIK